MIDLIYGDFIGFASFFSTLLSSNRRTAQSFNGITPRVVGFLSDRFLSWSKYGM